MSKQTTNKGSLEDLSSELISVSRASEISGLTPGYIRRLLRQNRINGKRLGRDWFTTEETIREYLKQARRRGRPKESGSADILTDEPKKIEYPTKPRSEEKDDH